MTRAEQHLRLHSIFHHPGHRAPLRYDDARPGAMAGRPESFQFQSRRQRMGIERRMQYMMGVRQKIRGPDVAPAEIES